MTKPNQEDWVKWMQSIEDAARSLKERPMCEEHWPTIVAIDETLWNIDREITNDERSKGNGSMDMPSM